MILLRRRFKSIGCKGVKCFWHNHEAKELPDRCPQCGEATEIWQDSDPIAYLDFIWNDWRVGVFYEKRNHVLILCPLPCVSIMLILPPY